MIWFFAMSCWGTAGIELAEKISERNYDMRFLFTAAMWMRNRVGRQSSAAGMPRQPCPANELLAAVDEALAMMPGNQIMVESSNDDARCEETVVQGQCCRMLRMPPTVTGSCAQHERKRISHDSPLVR